MFRYIKNPISFLLGFFVTCYFVCSLLTSIRDPNEYILKLPNIVVRLLEIPITSNWHFTLFVVVSLCLLLSFVTYTAWPFYIRVIKTKWMYWCYVHGFALGILVGFAIFILRNLDFFQKAYLFNGDYLIISLILGSLINYSKREKTLKAEDDNKKGRNVNLSSSPINSSSEDRLEYGPIINELEKLVIKEVHSLEMISLLGPNGVGKTSVLNLLKEKFCFYDRYRKDYRKKYKKNYKNNYKEDFGIKYEERYFFHSFSALSYRAEEDIIRGFYNALVELIKMEGLYPKLWNVSSKFQKIFSGVQMKAAPFSISFKDYFGKTCNTTFEKLSVLIEEHLEAMNLNLVLFIDDLERCSINKKYIFLQLTQTIQRLKRVKIIVSGTPGMFSYVPSVELRSIVE
ncbi:P-loop NTPase fold protein [Chitinispirillales bacterium ANBcel5]|uniref:P-loop NTPase fold protein n=1 Tax=Cellulosispirillum alkaliphilum TaxID=3039283 RepID=UPI002A4E4D7C|nr:P-loop NTPase fold protein [Chitinispirillales bacterium ANBcel5]